MNHVKTLSMLEKGTRAERLFHYLDTLCAFLKSSK